MSGKANGEKVLRDIIAHIPEIAQNLKLEQIKIKNKELTSVCPFHNEYNQKPSFHINLTNGKAYCDKCCYKGNIIDVYAKLEGLSIKGAVLDLIIMIKERKNQKNVWKKVSPSGIGLLDGLWLSLRLKYIQKI